jgi:hypothetical protein
MLVQDSTAEERDAYSDTTQGEPEAAAATLEALEAEEVGACVVSGASTDKEVLTTGRMLFTRVVFELMGVSMGTTGAALVVAGLVGTALVMAALVATAPD